MDTDTAGGQPDWCPALYSELASGLILYGRSLGLSHGESEDVVQDTFVALLQLTEKPEHPRHYCLRTFRHRAINHHRSLWRRLTRNLESARWFEPPHPESPVEQSILRELQRLPPEQREVVVLKIWHRMTFNEIARIQECPANTVSGRYRYALDKLRKSIDIQKSHEDEHPAGIPDFLLETTPPLGRT